MFLEKRVDLVKSWGGLLKPPWTKFAISAPFCDPIELEKIDFLQEPMGDPPIPIWGLEMRKEGFSIELWLLAVTNIRSWN